MTSEPVAHLRRVWYSIFVDNRPADYPTRDAVVRRLAYLRDTCYVSVSDSDFAKCLAYWDGMQK